jgi:hypothetical protein
MNATEKKYNGWTNYETWAVNLWLGNEQESYTYWRNAAQEAWNDAEDDRPKYFTRSEQARYSLSETLRSEINDGNPLADQPSVYTDLLNAAISECDWAEIANALLDDIEGYESAA